MCRTIALACVLAALGGTNGICDEAAGNRFGRRVAAPSGLKTQQKAKNEQQADDVFNPQPMAIWLQGGGQRSQQQTMALQPPTARNSRAAVANPGAARPLYPSSREVEPRKLPDLMITYVTPDSPGKRPKIFDVTNRGFAAVNGVEAELSLQDYYGRITVHELPRWNGTLQPGETVRFLAPQVGSAFDRRNLRVDPANKVLETNERNNSWFIDRVN